MQKKSKIKPVEFKKELQEQKKVAEELKEDAQRVQADFENFVKRMEKEKEEFRKFSNKELIAELLPVLDSFEEGIKSVKKQETVLKGDFLKGFQLLKRQFSEVLKKHGLKEIESVGKPFDPHIHECMLKEQDKTKQDEIVLEQLQKGYLLHGKVLRTSKVKINKLEVGKNE